MKSILQQGTSVFKAIEKAWVRAGRPADFSVKIHENGQKNFFGFTKKPAVVSLLFECKIFDDKKRKETYLKQKSQDAEHSKEQDMPKKAVIASAEQLQSKRIDIRFGWNNELASDIRDWIEEIAVIMNIKVAFTCVVQQMSLRITFKDGILDTVEEERMLFSSFAYLLLQGLKKKHKNKFRNFRIILTTSR